MTCKKAALQCMVLEAKIVELGVLIISGARSYENRFIAVVSGIAAKLSRMTIDIAAPIVIDGDRSIVDDQNSLGAASRKHFYTCRANWKKA